MTVDTMKRCGWHEACFADVMPKSARHPLTICAESVEVLRAGDFSPQENPPVKQGIHN